MAQLPIILASGSRYRLERLQQASLPVITHPANIDETPLENEAPSALAQRLAEQKALAVASQYEQALIIGCDQVASVTVENNTITLGKPGNVETAKQQLAMCCGKTVTFYTALAVVDSETSKLTYRVETVDVEFNALTDAQINQYIAIDSPLDCAGSFMMEKAGIFLFKSIQTRDPNSLLGIPLIALRECFAELGHDILQMLKTESN